LLSEFQAAIFAAKHRKNISQLTVADLDTPEHLWGALDSSLNFRNVLVGSPDQKRELWQAWISSGDMEMREDFSFFVLHHSCELYGRKLDRWAIYGAVDIHDPLLFVHEDVLPEGVERARQGTEACEADLAPIFVGCESTVGVHLREMLIQSVSGLFPTMEFKENDKSIHQIWTLPAFANKEVHNLLDQSSLFLLDGHHRLAAAIANDRQGLGDKKILACLCSLGSTDTLILPIHRSVYYERWVLPEVFLADLREAGCVIAELEDTSVSAIWTAIQRKVSQPFCVAVHSHAAKPYLITLPAVNDLSPVIGALSVACLENGVLKQHPQATLIPAASTEGLLEQLALDQCHVGFFLPPATEDQVIAIASAQMKMPRKSTRFVPKPALGLLTRPWTS